MPRKPQSKNSAARSKPAAQNAAPKSKKPSSMAMSHDRRAAVEPTQEIKRPLSSRSNGPTTMKAAEMKPGATPAASPAASHEGQNQEGGSKVIPFRQPGWDRQSEFLSRQQTQQAQLQARNGYGRVASRFNHSRGK
jgi:hypothetical protein